MKKTKMKKKNLLGNLTAKIMGALRGRGARLQEDAARLVVVLAE